VKTTVIDLKKAQWADFLWTNGAGVERKKKPRNPTVNGDRFDENAKAFMGNGETMLERATRKGLLDVWKPKVIFQFAANHCKSFTGDRAMALWKEWNAIQFGKRNKNGRN